MPKCSLYRLNAIRHDKERNINYISAVRLFLNPFERIKFLPLYEGRIFHPSFPSISSIDKLLQLRKQNVFSKKTFRRTSDFPQRFHSALDGHSFIADG